MRTKLFLVAVVVVVASMLLSACMVPAQPAQTVEVEKTVVVQVTAEPAKNAWGKVLPAGAAPPDQQVLTLPCQEGKDLDVSATFYQSAKSCGAVQLWERLVMLDENNKVVPGVATTWELAPDGLSWTFHLRPDAKWSDGSPLTAGDFEYALKRQLDPKTGSDFTWFYSDIKNAGKVSNGELPPTSWASRPSMTKPSSSRRRARSSICRRSWRSRAARPCRARSWSRWAPTGPWTRRRPCPTARGSWRSSSRQADRHRSQPQLRRGPRTEHRALHLLAWSGHHRLPGLPGR